MSASVAERVDAAMGRVSEELQKRNKIERDKAGKVWRELCHKMADGGELTANEMGKLEDAAAALEIKADDLPVKFIESVELLQWVAQARKTTENAEERERDLLGRMRDAESEIERLTTRELPRLRGVAAQCMADANSLGSTLAKLGQVLKANPHLFPEVEV